MGSRRGSEDYDDLSLEGGNGMGELMVDEQDGYEDDLLDPNPQQTKIEQIIQDMSIPDDEISGAGEEEELPHAERRDEDHDDMDAVVERINNGLNRPHFPVVSLPSLDQSANNTPRVSYGFGLAQYLPSGHAQMDRRTKNHGSKGSGLVKDMVQEDSREENHRGSSGPREEVGREEFRMPTTHIKRPPIASSAIGQRLRDREQQVQLQMYERDIQMLQEQVRNLQHELEKSEARRQDAIDWGELQESETEGALDALRGRILAKAVEERDRAKVAKQQSEKQLQSLESEVIRIQTENEAIRSAAESQLQELEDSLARAEAVAEGYRASESEARKELDAARKEGLQLQRQVESMFQNLHSQEEQLRMAQAHINKMNACEDDLREKLNEKDHQIHKLSRTLENLQKVTEGLPSNREPTQSKVQGDEDANQQLSELNWQIHELKRQLLSQKAQKMTVSTQVDKRDHSAQCTLLEDFFTQFSQRILEVHGLAEPGSEASLKEVHTKISQSLSDLKSRCQNLTEENARLRRSIDHQAKSFNPQNGTDERPSKSNNPREHMGSAASVLSQQIVQQSLEFESKFSKQQDIIRELQEKLAHYESLVKQSRTEITTLLNDNEALKDKLAISNAKAAEHSRLCKLQEEKLNTMYREQQTSARGSLMSAKQAALVDVEAQVSNLEAEFDQKIKSLEKQIKDHKHDINLKNRLISELQSTKHLLEEEIGELRPLQDELGESKKRLETAEKKLNTVNQDVSLRDKKNIELFEANKKLKSENQELVTHNQALQEKLTALKSSAKSSTKSATHLTKKSAMVMMSGVSEGGNSTGVSVPTSLLSTPLTEEENARYKWILENIEDAKLDMAELYRKVDSFYLEKNIMLQNLEQQSKRSMTLAKEVQFLRGCLEAANNSQDKRIELEMLSSEETEHLLDKILKRALKSTSMQRRLRESMEFIQLCTVIAHTSSKG